MNFSADKKDQTNSLVWFQRSAKTYRLRNTIKPTISQRFIPHKKLKSKLKGNNKQLFFFHKNGNSQFKYAVLEYLAA